MIILFDVICLEPRHQTRTLKQRTRAAATVIISTRSQYVLVLFSTCFVRGRKKGRLMFQLWTHFSPQEVGT